MPGGIWALTKGQSSVSSESPVSGKSTTCWVTVAIIVGVIIFILVINDLIMRKQEKYKKLHNKVRFQEEENDEDDEQENKIMKKSQCPYKH
jgi:short subunit fatty acids transporter